jgi:hypothetical protein
MQVVLLLRIRCHDVPECFEKPVETERVDAGVDFANGPLRGRGITLLDDPCNLPARPHDATVTCRFVHCGGDDRDGCASCFMAINQGFQRVRRQKRDIAGEQDDGP